MVERGAAGRRARARQEMRQAVLEAARRIVAEEGVANLSMRAIARAIGYSPAALYEYFPAKEDVCRVLFFEGAEGLAGQLERALAELPDGTPPVEAMRALGRAYRAYALANPELYRLVFASSMIGYTPDDAAIGRSKGGFDLLLETARRGVEAGDFASLPAEAIAIHCWSATHGFVMLEINGMLTGPLDDRGPGVGPPVEALFDAHLDLTAFGFVRR